MEKNICNKCGKEYNKEELKALIVEIRDYPFSPYHDENRIERYNKAICIDCYNDIIKTLVFNYETELKTRHIRDYL